MWCKIMLMWYVLLLVLVQFSFVSLYRNNVCRTFGDYATIETNKNCWYNPDMDSSPVVIAKRYGYPLKKYRVTTEDGYILTLMRITHNGSNVNSTRQPVLVQHGIGASGNSWLLQGQGSLAFVLVDNGYDVWLSTTRGSGYSRKHVHLTLNESSYWNFGLHELGVYDLPANIEFISNMTGQKGNIIYIGHSMGSIISYIYSSVKKAHAESHLKGIISFSPVAFFRHFDGWQMTLSSAINWGVPILQKLGIYSIGDSPPLNRFVNSICGRYPSILLCESLLLIFVGIEPSNFRPELLPLFTKHFPAGVSLKVVRHLTQLAINKGIFQNYDYGIDNRIVYRTATPPLYDVTNISVPVYLFIGTQDAISPERDVDILYNKLNLPERKTRASKYVFDFAHVDFLMADGFKGFYKVLLDVMKTEIGNKYCCYCCLFFTI